MKILITGGLGFVGSNLIPRLQARLPSARIVILDKVEKCATFRRLPRLDTAPLIKLDVRDRAIVDVITDGVDIVVHLAAESHVQNSIADPYTAFEVNAVGTLNVLEGCRRSGARLLFFSTSEIFGSSSKPIAVGAPLVPHSPYAAAKIGADRLVHAYRLTYGVNSTIVRPFNLYGPMQHPEKLISMLICSAIAGLPFLIQGDGTSMRDFSYIGDACGHVIDLLGSENPDPISIGSGTSLSVEMASALVAKVAGIQDPAIIHYRERSGNVSSQVMDVDQSPLVMRRCATGVLEGINATFEWYSRNRDYWLPDFLSIRDDIQRRLRSYDEREL